MNLTGLLINGRPDAGKLEKFSDTCNSVLPVPWAYKIELLKEGTDYILGPHWNEIGRINEDWCYHVIVCPIRLIAFFIYIPFAIIIGGVGLATKKIALAMDEHSKRYQIIGQRYLALDDFVIKFRSLKIDKRHNDIDLKNSKERINKLTNLKLVGDLKKSDPIVSFFCETVQAELARLQKLIKTCEDKTVLLDKEIQLNTEKYKELKTEIEELLKTYLFKKNGKLEGVKIRYSEVSDIQVQNYFS